MQNAPLPGSLLYPLPPRLDPHPQAPLPTVNNHIPNPHRPANIGHTDRKAGPIDLTYSALSKSASSGHIVFRVWTSSSASPLELVDGDMDRSGFSAPAGAHQHLGRAGYRALTKGLADSAPMTPRPEPDIKPALPLGQGHWANSASLRKKAINHILGRAPSAVERSKQEESVWISTTRCLNWAIWDSSRRLAFAYASELPDIAPTSHSGTAPHSTAPARKDHLQVHLSIIKIDPPARPGDKTPLDTDTATASSHAQAAADASQQKKGPSEMWIRARDVLSSALDTIPMNALEHRDCVSARNRAGLCEEVLFYGRIFGDSVLADFVFTANALPFSLPSQLYRPLSIQGNTLPGWMQRVRWDPLADKPNWPAAKELIQHGVYRYPTTWYGQPVAHIASHWPNKMYRSQAMSVQRSSFGHQGRGSHVNAHRHVDPPRAPRQHFGGLGNGRVQDRMDGPPFATRQSLPHHMQYSSLRHPAADSVYPQAAHTNPVNHHSGRPLHYAHVPVPIRPAHPHNRQLLQPLNNDMRSTHPNQGSIQMSSFHPGLDRPSLRTQDWYQHIGTHPHGSMYGAHAPTPGPAGMYGTAPTVYDYDYGPIGGDLMGPETWERAQMARAEAMLIDLQMR